ncbi:hypothetical protein Tco_0878134 [Tanacetum coccineum]|uniref:Uncharacterized protein n=1 Tax=Tanacetum coccineum TaxID=301880 RepID=A0ABQ5C0H3_9ASTR
MGRDAARKRAMLHLLSNVSIVLLECGVRCLRQLVDFAVLEDMDAYRDEGMGNDLAAMKLTKLLKYQSSGILCVIVVMLEYRRIYNTHPCAIKPLNGVIPCKELQGSLSL